jgi:hypothetical protein
MLLCERTTILGIKTLKEASVKQIPVLTHAKRIPSRNSYGELGTPVTFAKPLQD